MEGFADHMANTGPPVLTLHCITHHYGAKLALDDVSFDVAPGRLTALLGLNGAGKTTIFSLVTGLFSAQMGRIEIAGRDLRASPSRALEPLGVVFQQPTLDLDLTVRQNLMYFAGLRGMAKPAATERIMRALDSLGMAERIDERVRALNGGHRRRVEIARALLHEPRILLLDEPTVGLDIPTRRSIVSYVHSLARTQGCAALWATHLIDEIEPGDDLIVIDRGRIKAAGELTKVVGATGAPSLAAAFDALTRKPESAT